MQYNACEAKASFNSIKSMSPIFIPVFLINFCTAGTGPVPINEGSTPATDRLTHFIIGFKPNSCALDSDIITTAAAPSFIPEELPAVTVPFSLKTGLSVERDSKLASDLGCSSVAIRTGSPLR